ncbi:MULTISPECIES: hypothetical protein [unclassified Variovorax]|uniref:hypothetical protein n=1 Tax=unclassified Variovorax TaxID=663243 RepID=UPI00076CEDF3|nr:MULTISPECIES: hypothetical protein [unclassified Variovorax]KWT72255.1 hypothetical protein APY03_6280 [Variovorax sp. WDL1]PNG53202.1 hypothetical protein CHC06_04548 [Variovorax sp. B2]PNG53774.1 hypothetical protein CHC07_03595 [Variovorax sp. B4]VTV11229.1 hypothetical protein WDL1CHR_02109 [Variovorax sp. WDL1]
MDTVTHTSFEIAARNALSTRNWRAAALLFTEAADEMLADVHGVTPVRADGLRRDAHLALGRTEEFKNYREQLRLRGCRDFRAEWEMPSGELVTRLLMPKRRA